MTHPQIQARLACRPEAFEDRYRSAADPWDFAMSPYEQHRYSVTLESLRSARYRSAFEPGCSIGALTARLAERCDELLATDVSETALAHARERCRSFDKVRFSLRSLTDPMRDDERFDLIVLSEIGYYFDRGTLALTARRLARHLLPDGELMAVHWLGHSVDHLLHGDEVHAVLNQALPLAAVHSARHEKFRLDSWVRDER